MPLTKEGSWLLSTFVVQSCARCLKFRAIALTLRAGLHSLPLITARISIRSPVGKSPANLELPDTCHGGQESRAVMSGSECKPARSVSAIARNFKQRAQLCTANVERSQLPSLVKGIYIL